jgi:DNA-binding GntR family transcriptional regulator
MSIQTLPRANAPAVERPHERRRAPITAFDPTWSGQSGLELETFRPAPTATAAVADQLRLLILRGRLRPGQLLHQQHLASRLGVSRMPVSHAFARLEAEGLVSITPSRFACAQVASISAEECVELFDIRQALESCALQRALRRHAPKTLPDLHARLQVLRASDTHEHWVLAGQELWQAIYARGAGDLTCRKIQWFRQFLERYCVAFGSAEAVDRASWDDRYYALVTAVEAGDETAALGRLAENLEAMRTLILGLLPCSTDAARLSASPH